MTQMGLGYMLPEDSELDSWQVQVKLAMLELQEYRKPYDKTWGNNSDNPNSGCTQDRSHKSTRIMKAGNPPMSYCCGATMEAFMLAWSNFFNRKRDLTATQMREVYKRFFVFGAEYATGCQGGLEYVAEHLNWVHVESSNNPLQLPFGAFVQIQFGATVSDGGHSAIVIGKGKREGQTEENYLIVWSSNVGYSYVIENDEKGGFLVVDGSRPSGHGLDYWSALKQGRSWFGAWIVG